MTDVETKRQAERTLTKHAKSFRWASFFLPARVRQDAAIVYAFCRYVDDVVDESPVREKARHVLARIADMLEGRTEPSPLLEAYLDVARRSGFGIGPALGLLDGMRSDLESVRVVDDAELRRYCYRVAGTVGLMMCGVLGATDPRALRRAVDLGIAMQLTNICRDVLEDARRDRMYLPRTRLAAVELDAEEITFRAHSPEEYDVDTRSRLSRVVRDLLAEADRHYESATQGYALLPARTRLAVTVAADLYRAIGVDLLSTREGDPLSGRASTSNPVKATIVARNFLAWALHFPRRSRIAKTRLRSLPNQ